MRADAYVEQVGRLVSAGRYREALDFAAQFEPTVEPPLGLDEVDQVTGLLEHAAMAVDIEGAAAGGSRSTGDRRAS